MTDRTAGMYPPRRGPRCYVCCLPVPVLLAAALALLIAASRRLRNPAR